MARRRQRSSFWGHFGFDEREQEPRPGPHELRQRLGRDPEPVRGEGRTFTKTFWGRAWCQNLERYHDYANRLPRGRTYLRRGAVLDLAIERGVVTALVFGRSLYEVRVEIAALSAKRWSALRKQCAGGLSSVIELLEGRIGNEVMHAVTAPNTGLFPEPRDITLSCSCPDWASMCKHVAAALYGAGIRLDERPQLLFELRGARAEQLVGSPTQIVGEVARERRLEDGLSEIFGVQIVGGAPAAEPAARAPAARKAPASKKTARVATEPAMAKTTPADEKAASKKAPSKKTSSKKTSSKKASTSKKAPVEATLTRKELLERGLPASTLQGWLRRRVLRPTGQPGIYALTEEAVECLGWYD